MDVSFEERKNGSHMLIKSGPSGSTFQRSGTRATLQDGIPELHKGLRETGCRVQCMFGAD